MKKKYLACMFFLAIPLLLWRCTDFPDEVALPVYDISLVMPVLEKNYSLREAVEDDSTYIKWYKDPSRFGQLYYSDEIAIEKILVKNNLKTDPFTTSAAQKIGPIKIYSVTPVDADITVSDLAEEIQTGTEIVFPEISKNLKKDFANISQFDSAIFSTESGTDFNKCLITITNTFPIPVELRGISLVDAQTGFTIVNKGDNNTPSEWIEIEPGISATVEFSLAGKTISNRIAYAGEIYTPGSQPASVVVGQADGLKLEISFSDKLILQQVTAVLPAQDRFIITDSFSIDDSTKLKNAIIENGFFAASVINSAGIDLSAKLEIESLIKSDGSTFSKQIQVSAYSSTTISEPDLSDWKIVADDLSGEIFYTLTIDPILSDQKLTLTKDDSLSAKIDFSEITFESIEGQVKPMEFVIDEAEQTIDFDSFEEKFEYNKINFNDAQLRLDLQTSANVDLQLNGTLSVNFDGGESRSEDLSILIPTTVPEIVNLGNLINGTNGQLPNKFFINGTAIINPDFDKNISVHSTDTVGGTAFIDLPLNATILGGSLIDTLELDESELDDEDAERLNSATLTIEISNLIPCGGSFTGALYDKDFNKLLDIPPAPVEANGTVSNIIALTPPAVNAEGNVTEAGYIKQVMEITGSDLKAFVRAANIIITINFETAGADQNRQVKFRYTDQINIKVTAEANVRVSE